MNLEELRKQAIDEGRCFSKSTLKDDFRMKPSPTAQPVKYFKNGFGGEFGVYRINDCVPMRPKKQATQKQVDAGKRLGARAKLGSKKAKAAIIAKAWIEADVLLIDTETTGVESHDQVIQIAVVDVHGQVLLDTRLQTTVPINPEALAIHKISAEALVDAPTWPEVAPTLRKLLEGRKVVAFNSGFDSRLLQQTAKAHDDDYWSWKVDDDHCAMALAAKAFGATNRYGSISLSAAVAEAGIEWQGQAHSALGDALTTLALVKAIARNGNESDISFTFDDQHYHEIHRAIWYQKDGHIRLEQKSEPGMLASGYDVSESIVELVALLEASGINVERQGELKRFDLEALVDNDQLLHWQKAFAHAQVAPEGNFEQALLSCAGVYHDTGRWALEPDAINPLELVSRHSKRRFPVVAHSQQYDLVSRQDVDYFFTDRFCWCSGDGLVLGLIPESQDQQPVGPVVE